MAQLTFNKQLSSKRQGNAPSVIFRKLPETGNNDRYQGQVNTLGVNLIKSLAPNYEGLKIVFSDSHSIIGFKPVEDKCVKSVFGATELFRGLNLVVGKKYKLTKVEEPNDAGVLVTIDSDEFK